MLPSVGNLCDKVLDDILMLKTDYLKSCSIGSPVDNHRGLVIHSDLMIMIMMIMMMMMTMIMMMKLSRNGVF